MKYMKYLTIWMTYHDDQLLTKYNLKETDTISLFKGNLSINSFSEQNSV